MSSEFLCVLPWIHVATETVGTTRHCCISGTSKHVFPVDDKTSVGDFGPPVRLGKNSLHEILNSPELNRVREQMKQGLVPPGCQICRHSEADFGASKRLTENQRWTERLGAFPAEPGLKYIDLRLGSTCNLKCVMCSSSDSSSWRSEGRRAYDLATRPLLKGTLKVLHVEKLREELGSDWHRIGSPFWDDFFSKLGDIKEIYFAGGEPLIQKEHRWCLEKIIEKGWARGIGLRYSTNLTVLEDAQFKHWDEFAIVHLSVSVDGFGKKAEFIRYPCRWAKVEENLRAVRTRFERDFVVFVMTVQALNILDVRDFFSWGEILANPRRFSSLYFNLLHLPKYLSVKVLPRELKKLARERFEAVGENPKIAESPTYEKWGAILDFMDSEDWSHLWPDFQEYMEILEKLRGVSFAEVFPELAEHFV